MGLNWSKQKRRDQCRQVQTAAIIDYDYAEEIEGRGPSKDELRAQAAAALASYRGPIRRLPSYAALRCRSCGHRGTARVAPGASPKFKCSACGSSLVAYSL